MAFSECYMCICTRTGKNTSPVNTVEEIPFYEITSFCTNYWLYDSLQKQTYMLSHIPHVPKVTDVSKLFLNACVIKIGALKHVII